MKNITVAGGGVLGSQIAFQTAFCGFNVKIWLRSEDSIGRTKPKLDRLYKIFKHKAFYFSFLYLKTLWLFGFLKF